MNSDRSRPRGAGGSGQELERWLTNPPQGRIGSWSRASRERRIGSSTPTRRPGGQSCASGLPAGERASRLWRSANGLRRRAWPEMTERERGQKRSAGARLSAEALRMARELGLDPRSLLRNVPSSQEPWKAPVEVLVRCLYAKRQRDRQGVPRQRGN